MITLEEALEILYSVGIDKGWIVGGLVEKGFSDNDADVILPEGTDVKLPEPFHLITDSKIPQGPCIALDAPTRPYPFMKPAKTHFKSAEYYDIDKLSSELPEGDYYVEPKYDGVRIQIIKNHDKVWIYTDTERNIANRLPNTVEETKQLSADEIVLDAELVMYRGRGRLDHTAVTSYLHSKVPAEDYHLIAKPFDILYLNGKELREKKLEERKKLLDENVKRGKHIHPVEYLKVPRDKVKAAIKEMATREGAMIKAADSTYNHSGKGWYKWKRQYHIDVKVKEVHEREGGYTYTCVLRDGTVIGETYVTKIKANKGDIIEVSVDHVTKKKDGSWGWYAPKVVAVREDKKEADPISVLEQLMTASSSDSSDAPSSLRSDGGEEGATLRSAPLSDLIDDGNGNELDAKLLSGNFVLQEHWWGKKHHFDLRFEKVNSKGNKLMFGWTLLVDSEDELFDKIYKHQKILALRKEYHDPRWLSFEGDIPPGNPGNPTVNLIAHMRIRDKGKYKFYRRSHDFVDVELQGTKSNALRGRFYIRRVKLNKEDSGEGEEKEQWLFWKASGSERDALVFDSIELNRDKAEKVKGGVIFKDVVFAKEMVQDYHGKRVLKAGSELRKALITAHRMMVTDDHPDLLRQKDIKGILIPGSQRWDPKTRSCIADILIWDEELLTKIKNGKRDLSIGFWCDWVKQSGEFNGETYDFVQRNIVFDHLAVVDRGRCSSHDGCGIVIDSDSNNDESEGDERMEIDGKIYDEQAVRQLIKDKRQLEERVEKLEAERREKPMRIILDALPLKEEDIRGWSTERLIELADSLQQAEKIRAGAANNIIDKAYGMEAF